MRDISLSLIVLLLLAIACAAGDDLPPQPTSPASLISPSPVPSISPQSPPNPTPPPVPPPTAPVGQPAAVVWVIDGDTIEVEIEGREYRVRYIGIDTPERDMPYYDEATGANRRLVEGQTVLLVKDVSETDRYGRLLRYIYLSDGTFVNAQLVEQGFAQAVTFPPDVAFADHFRQLQVEARQDGRGLWAE